jgi:hypothetical protein
VVTVARAHHTLPGLGGCAGTERIAENGQCFSGSPMGAIKKSEPRQGNVGALGLTTFTGGVRGGVFAPSPSNLIADDRPRVYATKEVRGSAWNMKGARQPSAAEPSRSPSMQVRLAAAQPRARSP